MKRICVFMGSSPGARPVYAEAARDLGRLLVERGLELVYGGSKTGLMGEAADTVLAAGGSVHGVMPRALVNAGIAHEGLTATHVTENMHERKALMSDLSDGFIALPGGIGTLEELFEIFTWSQLGFHGKPLALLNVDGYYDGLTTFLSHAVEERFLKQAHKDALILEKDARTILDAFAVYKPQVEAKWIDRKQA